MKGTIHFDAPDELDRQYDISAAVPEITDVVQEMVLQSITIKQEHPNYQECSYGDYALQTLDFFPAGESASLLVYIHGGYWHALDKAVFSTVGEAWNKVGISVAVVNYRLAPLVCMADIVSDVQKAIIYLWRHSDNLAFNKDSIVVCGSSAGGHLTTMMLATNWSQKGDDLPENLLKGGASISGLHDLEPFTKAPFLKDIVQLTETDVRDFSPARLKPATLAPLITCVGGDESSAFHAQNKLIAEKWAHVFKEDIASANTNHVTVNTELTNPESLLFKAVHKLFG